MSIYSAIPCAEVHDSAFEAFDILSGMRAGVDLICGWADRHELVADILGNHRPYPNSSFPNPPQAVHAAIKPEPGSYVEIGQSCYYSRAVVTIDYDSAIKDLLSESLEPNAEFIIHDHKQFVWGFDGNPLLEGEAPGKIVRGLNIVRTNYEMASIPAAVLTSVGCVNNATYNSAILGLSFPAETLLYNPPTTSRVITSTGTEGWTLTQKFSFKPDTWNKFWRAKTGFWEEIHIVGTGVVYKNYPLKNFASLFV